MDGMVHLEIVKVLEIMEFVGVGDEGGIYPRWE